MSPFPATRQCQPVKPALSPRFTAVAGKPTNDLVILSFDAAKTIKVILGRRAREVVTSFLFVEVLEPEALRLHVLG